MLLFRLLFRFGPPPPPLLLRGKPSPPQMPPESTVFHSLFFIGLIALLVFDEHKFDHIGPYYLSLNFYKLSMYRKSKLFLIFRIIVIGF